MTLDWDKIVAQGLSLPETELSTHYGAPAVKVNGNAFIAPGREAGSFCLMLDLDTVEVLKGTDPATYWQTPHYEGWPGVLVRFDTDDPERVLAMIEKAHARAAAKPRPKPRRKR